VVVFGRRVPAGLWWALAELFALTGLAIAQPLLDVTGKAPDFFLLHRADRAQILLLVALIVLAPRWACGRRGLAWPGRRRAGPAAGPSRPGDRPVLRAAPGGGQEADRLRGRPLVLAALVVGVAAGLVYARWRPSGCGSATWPRPAGVRAGVRHPVPDRRADPAQPPAADRPVPVQTRPGSRCRRW
jgi:hypothetical protein